MATARQLEDLNVWQEARLVVGAICAASRAKAFNQDFNLRDQIRRAAISTMSNIAEGFERGSRKEFVRFLHIAKESNDEVHSQLHLALDQKYIGEVEFAALRELAIKLSKKLSVFIRYLEGCADNTRMKKPLHAARNNLQLSTGNLQPT
jgi:four helix bundle protein